MEKRVTEARIVLDMPIRQVYQDFLTSREAMRVQPSTMVYYRRFLGIYVDWLEKNNIVSLEEAANPQIVQAFLTEIARTRAYGKSKPYADSTVHIYARTIRTMLRYAFENEWLARLPRLKMPILHKTKLTVLNETQLEQVFRACETTRDLAIMLVMVASGLRRGEISALNWQDVDFGRSSLEVLEGKGKKFRRVKIDKETAKILLRYRNELGEAAQPNAPLFQNRDDDRLAGEGYRSLFMRLSKRSGVKFSAHALRRTFAKMCLKQGMDLIFIQNLMGHAQADTTVHYIQQLDDEDVKRAYDDHTPIEDLARRALRRKPQKK